MKILHIGIERKNWHMESSSNKLEICSWRPLSEIIAWHNIPLYDFQICLHSWIMVRLQLQVFIVKQLKFDSKIRNDIKIWNKIHLKERSSTLEKLKVIVKVNSNKLYQCFFVITGEKYIYGEIYIYGEKYDVSFWRIEWHWILAMNKLILFQ